MRWDFFLFFASLVAATLGGHWGLYLGIAGMIFSGLHGVLKLISIRRSRMLIIIGMIVSGTIFGGLCLFYFAPSLFGLNSSDFADQAESVTNISFQKLSVFCVEIDKNIYQVGVVVKLFNLDPKPYLINGIGFIGSVQNAGMGSYYLQHIYENTERAEFIEDNYIKPSSEGYYKWLMPLKYGMEIIGGTPGFIFIGPWQLILGDKRREVTPQLYANYDRVISRQEWNDLLKPTSKIDLDSLQYRESPILPEPGDGQIHDYILFNPDRSANIDIFGFSQTSAVRGEKGVMLLMRGVGKFYLPGAWRVLGNTYSEVWADPAKLALYNSLFPPDKDGKPRPFGVFQ